MEEISGGYEAGYLATDCFWGTDPSSLVRAFLSSRAVEHMLVLDAGCGEGKNANAFAQAGAQVVAVDCSSKAVNNGKSLFRTPGIEWNVADIKSWPLEPQTYDVVVSYGLLHCMPNEGSAVELVERLQSATKTGGYNIICTFNDRSHDLSAHEGFSPLLLPHERYVGLYGAWELLDATDSDLHETHPHNGIPHHHSLTRLTARKIDA